MKHTAAEIFDFLNTLDECHWIEAKLASESGKSILETIVAFSNEPGMHGGYLILGVSRVEGSLFPEYKITGINDPDKLQMDIASQCVTQLNIPVRPEISVELLQGYRVLVIFVPELSQSQKPVFFSKLGLPKGAYRRIGSTDQQCQEDDMRVFYHDDKQSYDSIPIKGTSYRDLDPNAINRYRQLRTVVNPVAEELTLDDMGLLQSLGCVNRDNPKELNLAGLLLFGTSAAQRSVLPMLRVDYIRVPGNIWVQDPDDRFTTIDMRGPLLLLLFRLIDAINADLPKGFLLVENNIQAQPTGLPLKALREAIVNALIHRSYREHRPTQIIRYDNRIEIVNPGFSLKPEEKLGQPGSETRNPFIAEVFHETQLAETKGSGLRAMKKLMAQAKLASPTFESSREDNEFTVRLLLHHFLDKKDLEWLKRFEPLNLNDNQKQALIFVREIGAIDNHTYRQMGDCDILRASQDLRSLKKSDLLKVFGKGKDTYYQAGDVLVREILNYALVEVNRDVANLSTKVQDVLNTEAQGSLSTKVLPLNTEVNDFSAEVNDIEVSEEQPSNASENNLSTEVKELNRDELVTNLPFAIQGKIKNLKERERDPEIIQNLIVEICSFKAFKLIELSSILQKNDNYLSRKYIRPLIESNQLQFLFPDIKYHPNQKYIVGKV